MEKRQLIMLCTIGKLNISFKSILEIKVDRNFSDVGNKFSIDLVDSPQVATYDLELYMNAGYRDITFKYGDLGTNKLTSYTGTIWDYTNTFVGNIKKLTITGICDRYAENKQGASTYLYNIDWNNYFNMRQDERIAWGTLNATKTKNELYLERYKNEEEATRTGSKALDENYRSQLYSNAKTLSLKGPSGKTIELPIPDCFYGLSGDIVPQADSNGDIPFNESVDSTTYAEYLNIVQDPNDLYWGELYSSNVAPVNSICPYPSTDTAIARIYREDDRYHSVAYILEQYRKSVYPKATGADFKEDFVYVSLEWYIKHCGKDPETLNFYREDIYALFLKGPIYNEIVYWGEDEYNPGHEKKYVLIRNKNKEIIGFRTDGYDSNHQRDAFVRIDDNPEFGGISPQAASVDERIWKRVFYDEGPENNPYVRETLSPEHNEKLPESLGYYYWKDKDQNIRAFLDRRTDNNQGASNVFYVQANPNKKSYGGAGIVFSNEGVDISHIVKQLCILEGWKYKDEDIVQTEIVPCADTFKMQNQSAFEFIQKNLIPNAITPIGRYKTIEGEDVYMDKPQGGFGIFFDKEGYLHFQPLAKTSLEKLTNIKNLGYNMPNSPTISFQVNTKGTAFYNFQPTTITATTITSGTEVKQVEVLSDAGVAEIKKTVGHNDTFDDWLGLKYDTVEKTKEKNKLTGSGENDGTKLLDNYLRGMAQNALVTSPTTKLVTSSVYSTTNVKTNIINARKYIEDFTITANMTMWGDYRIKPAAIIKITNMVKGGDNNSNIPQKHPSSGEYLILKISETISASSYVQSLDLLRDSADLKELINPYNIDYTIAAENYNKGEEDIGATVSDVVFNDETGEWEMNGTYIPKSWYPPDYFDD